MRVFVIKCSKIQLNNILQCLLNSKVTRHDTVPICILTFFDVQNRDISEGIKKKRMLRTINKCNYQRKMKTEIIN